MWDSTKAVLREKLKTVKLTLEKKKRSVMTAKLLFLT